MERPKYAHKFNEVIEEGDILHIKVKHKEVIVDKEDLKKIYPTRVYIGKNGYAYCGRSLIHRMIMDAPGNSEIDHINHNPLDNRKSNLRVTNRSGNGRNRKIVSNTGEYGITKRKDGWFMVTVADKYRGIRRTLEEARALRDESLVGTEQLHLNYFLRDKG